MTPPHNRGAIDKLTKTPVKPRPALCFYGLFLCRAHACVWMCSRAAPHLRCSAPVSRRTCAALHQFRSAPAPHILHAQSFAFGMHHRKQPRSAKKPSGVLRFVHAHALPDAFCTPAKRAFARFAEGLDGSPRPARAKAPRGMRSARTPQAPRAFLELSGELCP